MLGTNTGKTHQSPRSVHEDMKGSTIDAMSDAVDNAAVM
eukprot:COSAG06_NODE_40801_length_398_cov_0.946488_1_plen_38_part_01